MVEIRSAQLEDAAGINEIGNYYILNTSANFKVDELDLEERQTWMKSFGEPGRHRLIVAIEKKVILGYACSTPFQDRCAYQTSISTTIYLHPDSCKKGLGTRLYSQLFRLLENEDLHRAFAGITLPNEASVAIHKKFGFIEVGVFREAGRKNNQYWDVLWMGKPL
jgi:phosphinothricin acetyltransferase